MIRILIPNIARIPNILIQRIISPFLKCRGIIWDMLGVHVRHLVEGLEPPLVRVVVHRPIPSVENLSLSLEVEWDWGVDFRTYLVEIGVFSGLVIGLLHACPGCGGSVNECPVVRWLVIFAISAGIAGIIIVVVLRSNCRGVNYPFHSSEVANSALLIRKPWLGGLDSRGHNYSLASFLAQWWAYICLCCTWRATFWRDDRCLLVLHDWSLLRTRLLCFLWPHIEPLALILFVLFKSTLSDELFFVLKCGIESDWVFLFCSSSGLEGANCLVSKARRNFEELFFHVAYRFSIEISFFFLFVHISKIDPIISLVKAHRPIIDLVALIFHFFHSTFECVCHVFKMLFFINNASCLIFLFKFLFLVVVCLYVLIYFFNLPIIPQK